MNTFFMKADEVMAKAQEQLWHHHAIAVDNPAYLGQPQHIFSGMEKVHREPEVMACIVTTKADYAGGRRRGSMNKVQPKVIAKCWPGITIMTDKEFLDGYFFGRRRLVDGPPNDRGCCLCSKIGNRAKDCLRRRGTKNNGSQNNRVQGGGPHLKRSRHYASGRGQAPKGNWRQPQIGA
ncbi:hypothetical protein IscW_ISCW004795 [Ixodes scapularis]|uniref:Uncharacterized protein n=1 Tax=Ixodes scapularis TaxID=6945 RepID=B7PJT1_IXOSC|nr:hypothetical protein IscW_ISCW004795 [Ixodes scapularis]|eukprot:XP_002408546.1 hypothetical protein IscW_ISCW004795 [Ixodes scapularis]